MITVKSAGFKIKKEVRQMKKKLTLFTILILLFLLAFPALSVYKLNRTIPSDIYLTKDKNAVIDLSGFVYASSETNCLYDSGKVVLSCPDKASYSVNLKLFGILPVKKLTVSSSENERFMPSGQAIGIKLYTDGVLVIKINENLPADIAGIKVGDIITHINGTKVVNASHFSSLLNENKQNTAIISYTRNSASYTVELIPSYSQNEYKIGAWVRDSSAGIGTLTYVSPDGSFGALGHGICDQDTSDLLTIMHANVSECEIVDCEKGEKGNPGRLCGILKPNELGILSNNSYTGIFGQIDKNAVSLKEPIPIATRFEVQKGKASILSTIDHSGVKEYSVLIEEINTASDGENSMVIKVTDENLIRKTGGIVQGMSGSPVIQNGKLVGAVTHVFVNDPTRGYGIFIENMLAEADKIK